MAVGTPQMTFYVNYGFVMLSFAQICLSVVLAFARFSKFLILLVGRDQPPHAMLLIGKPKFTRSKARPVSEYPISNCLTSFCAALRGVAQPLFKRRPEAEASARRFAGLRSFCSKKGYESLGVLTTPIIDGSFAKQIFGMQPVRRRAFFPLASDHRVHSCWCRMSSAATA
jgi:hypothetical protein